MAKLIEVCHAYTMKNQNMRDLEKRWAEQRKKAEEKAAKAALKKDEPAAKKSEAGK